MIKIKAKNEKYLYTVYHLVRAFLPGEEVIQEAGYTDGPDLVIEQEGKADLVLTAEICREQLFPEGPQPDLSDIRQRKYVLDRAVYAHFSEETGKKLPWGILTGVRPTKIAMGKLLSGMKAEEFVPWFQKDSLVSEEKARLAYEIAGRERKVTAGLDTEKGYSLYIGIPFCPSICSYCSFSSGSLSQYRDAVEPYLDALIRELEFIAGAGKGRKPDTIYIGGGTPTSLTANQLQRLLTVVDELFDTEHLLEYTVEAGRPDSITREKLSVIKSHPVTRISINPQTMQQRTLDLVGRKHTVQEVVDVFHIAREMGFDNINMDLIAGLPGETVRDMEDTLEKIAVLAPDSLTVHALAIKRAAALSREENGVPVSAEIEDMVEAAHRACKAMGLHPYYLYRQKNIAGNFENVGFAKVDKAGIYNILIMEEIQSIVAAGAGATTKIVLKDAIPVAGRKDKYTTLVRVENVKNIREYITRIDEMIKRKGEWLWPQR